MKKKIYNNVKGLGHAPFNLNALKQTIESNKNCEGFHHVKHQINVLQSKYVIQVDDILKNDA